MTRFAPSQLLAALRRLLRHEQGNVAMLFGLLLVPMLGVIGLAVDFGEILTARNKAQVAADAAALQAAGVAQDLIRLSDGSPAATASAIAEAEQRARRLFKAHADQSALTDYTATVTVTRTGQTINSRVVYSVATQTYLAKFFGQNAYDATGSAISSIALQAYTDVYLTLDVSQSMGIAATQAEMTRLFNARVRMADGTTQPTSCVFGCHNVEDDYAESFTDVAKRNGIKLRIDVLREATKTLIATAKEDALDAPVYRIALYAMGMKANYGRGDLLALAGLTDDFAALTAAAGNIALGPSPGNGYSDSYQNETLVKLNNLLPSSLDGSTQAKAKKYAIIITDGVRDTQQTSNCIQTYNRCVSPVEQASCDAMKRKGITVGVLYTTYVPPRPYDRNDKDWYTIQVVDTGVAARIAPALRGCASPGWFFEASDSAGIENALAAMFKQTQVAPTLTQ